MTTIAKLTDLGIVERRYETVELFRGTNGLRADLWSQPGEPRPQEGEVAIGQYEGPVICVRHHAGRWGVAREELQRLAEALNAPFPQNGFRIWPPSPGPVA